MTRHQKLNSYWVMNSLGDKICPPAALVLDGASATWPSLPKRHYNGLNQTKPNIYFGHAQIAP